MKWWGWGDENIAFSHGDKPDLAPFFKRHIGMDLDAPGTKIIDFSSLTIPASILPAELKARLVAILGSEHVSDEAMDRVVHTYGKSFRDLIRVRRNDLGRLPDVVIYPASEEEVSSIVTAALAANAVLIPFGGGTNISGSLEASREEARPIISVDMGRMSRVIEIDEMSQTARIQAGVLGPDMEKQLNNRGWTLGHFPDSFNHSTLGGWIATRSSGMQSDKYGDIADITRSVRVVTPNGVLATRPVPSTSTGPSVREMILGSEGRLGIITEATVHVHRIPEQRKILGYLFPDWPRAIQAMHEIASSDIHVSITRVSDAKETAFSFATKKQGSFKDALLSKAMKAYLKHRKGMDVSQMCLSFVGYEGNEEYVKTQRSLVGKIVSKYGGIGLGSSPGELYDQKKFDTPYIRDYILDRGGLADVSETSTPWSQLVAMHDGIVERANKAFEEIDVRGYIMCHMSHSYHSGACLYFTFAFCESPKMDAIAQYDVVKQAIQQGFMDLGGTLSHHHAVGTEHAPWLEQDISAPGVNMLHALFNGVDPGRNFNPGKIVS